MKPKAPGIVIVTTDNQKKRSMEKTKDLVKIYTGPEASVILIKAQLEELGVYTLTKNDFTGAYMGMVQPSIDLWISEDDLQKAKPVIDDFITNQSDGDEL